MHGQRLIQAVRTIEDFDYRVFTDLGIGVELQDFTEPCLSDSEVYAALNGYEKKFRHFTGIKAMHGSFIDLNIASFNRDIAAYSRKMYKRDLFFAKLLGIDYLIFHTQIMPWFRRDFKFDLFSESTCAFFAEAVENSGFAGLVVLENVCDRSPEMTKLLIDAVNHKQVKMNLDVGHALISGESLESWISVCAPVISYFHLHSNNGIEDLHQPVTVGDFLHLTALIKKHTVNAPICLEYWGEDIKKDITRLASCCR